ncbi:MAG: DUF4870 domain-containing protein [Bacteroidaceae bacterium]|nr:DUF4870 domain-containing protein [Bacteroidaceae bacterium]
MKIEDLEKLSEMRNSGAISEEEYQQIKTNLLESSATSGNDELPLGLSASNYCAIMNFIQLFFGAGWVISIIMWVIGKDKSAMVMQQGNYIMNWLISGVIYGLVAAPLIIFTLGIGVFFYIALAICSLLFPIIGGLKSLGGTAWKYPLSIAFLK